MQERDNLREFELFLSLNSLQDCLFLFAPVQVYFPSTTDKFRPLDANELLLEKNILVE